MRQDPFSSQPHRLAVRQMDIEETLIQGNKEVQTIVGGQVRERCEYFVQMRAGTCSL